MLVLILLLSCINNEPVQLMQEPKAKQEENTENKAFFGDVVPWQVIPMSFKVEGRVSKVFFHEGDFVKKGQILAELEDTDYKLTLSLAKTQVEALTPHYERSLQLIERGAISPAQGEEIASSLLLAKVQLEQASALHSYTRLFSSIDGVIIKELSGLGEMVGPAVPICAVADLNKVKIVVPVSQKTISEFVLGENLKVMETENSCEVYEIGLEADTQTRTFPVTFVCDNSDLVLRAGMIVELSK